MGSVVVFFRHEAGHTGRGLSLIYRFGSYFQFTVKIQAMTIAYCSLRNKRKEDVSRLYKLVVNLIRGRLKRSGVGQRTKGVKILESLNCSHETVRKL